ncbi:lipocalin family protein [Desulfosarcina sp.]|uniref:lipocalin family protein n=1 Tax=Desulfosarcina sp. TaxID=2027861 RepID=UPI0029B42E7B|nr:lipocalin family protein [Desulfosarcina sp.]MDX2452581.1 lipocalin family protein [Desulfosarcina sp.]MDX2490351.1 lipocalin family protein [Desulfosarcina sp.]
MPEYANAKGLSAPRMWLTLLFFFGLLGPPVQAAADEDSGPLSTVSAVDLNRYLGKWYEIASYPAWFQRGCTGSTADYSLLPDGRIRVVNRCFKNSLDGPLKVSKGKAEVVDTATHARLKVWFFWPFKGDYWIIDLDDDYQWAVVGVPSRKYLWILSRTPTLDGAVYDGILRRVIEKGYDPTRLQLTPQPE